MQRFLRIQDVVNMTGLGKSTIWLWAKEQKFPQPIKISANITVWDINDIEEWMEVKKAS